MEIEDKKSFEGVLENLDHKTIKSTKKNLKLMAEHCKSKPGYYGFFSLENGEIKMEKRKKMVLDAWRSMKESLSGYAWCSINSGVRVVCVHSITPNGFKMHDGATYDNFSLTDPRPREAPPKGTVVMATHNNKTRLYFSGGEIDEDRLLIFEFLEGFDNHMPKYTENWVVIGKVPEDLT